jgi:hypothetical protein
VAATVDGVLLESWPSEEADGFDGRADNLAPECEFFNGSIVYESTVCSHFAISRLPGGVVAKAIERAGRCAQHFETECILSAEVGLSVPAAFVYDHAQVGMRMLLAPSIHNDESGEQVYLRVNAQDSDTRPFFRKFNETLQVSYLPAGRSRAPVTEVLSGPDAWCVQLLRQAYSPECWNALD